MTLLAVPNLSEGRDLEVVKALVATVESSQARLLDTHSDPVHNRTVLTVTGDRGELSDAMVNLARAAARSLNLGTHDGVHPRVGVLDVCPFVPHHAPLAEAVEAAKAAAESIGDAGIPVFLYGGAGATELPELRRGGLEGLIDRVGEGLRPDFGPTRIDAGTGVVCVGARGPLIAFNVNVGTDIETARAIAGAIRNNELGIRALGLPMPEGSQVSMNLTQPQLAGIDAAFSAVEEQAEQRGAHILSTEIVGLVEERFLPNPDAKAARLLIEPGRSVESALKG